MRVSVKVAIVGAYPRDPGRLRGGVEAVTFQLARGLAALPDVDVHAVVCEAGRPLGVVRTPERVTVHSIGGSTHGGNLLFAKPDRRRIARTLRELAPDIVHAHGVHREALGALDSGLPTVVTIHGILEAEIGLETRLGKRVRGIFRRRLVASVFRRMRHVILLTPEVEEYYRDRLRGARMWVIGNPVDPRFFETREPEQPGVVLFSGRLIPLKGVPNLIEAMARVARELPGAQLRVAGGSAARGRGGDPRHDRAAGHGRGRAAARCAHARGAGAGDRKVQRVRAGLEAGDASRRDSRGHGRREAVVASPVGGVPRVVRDGETGFLVPHGEPARLAELLLRLLRDAELRARLGGNARRFAAEHFTLESVSRRTLDVYRQVIEGGHA